jgi:protein O-mannosyl-transferase
MRKSISANGKLNAEKKRDITFSLLVVFAAFALYANSLGNGFVWDDDIVIIANSTQRNSALALFRGIDAGRDTDLTPYYRPLTLLTFLIEDRLHGLNPFLMHFLNVLLHAANAFLVYRLARSLLNDNYAALLAGMLFAVGTPFSLVCLFYRHTYSIAEA